MDMNIITLLLLLILTASCAPPEEGTSTNESDKYPSPYVPATPVTYNADVYFYQGVTANLDVTSNILNNLPAPTGSYQYSLSDEPAWMSINSTSGVISGVPTTQGLDNFTVTATDSGNGSNTHSETVSLAVNGDPLRSYQWHLNNTGQSSFALTGGVAGKDIDAYEVYQNGIFGSGVKIAVSDAGGEINHDDLYQNIIDNASKDYTLAPPYLGNPIASSAHGTAVAGLIGARGWNNIGVTGVAPYAGLAIFQFLESAQSLSILIDQASGNFDIFNYSYGDTLYYDTQSDPDYLDHIKSMVANGRGGKGSIFVKAAGNEYLQYDDAQSPTVCASHNANFPFENESPYLLVVGAVNADGVRASYSNTGSNIWVSGPGGEYGFNYPAMVTTDLPTCFKGYAKAAPFVYNDFEYGHSLNEKCNFTSTMNGTSSAAPVVSGVIALMLEANPNLTNRDVKHILAMTATKVDIAFNNGGYHNSHPSVNDSSCSSITLSGHTYEQGWVPNGASLTFSNAYGFGLVNAQAAVAMATNFASDPLSWLPIGTLVETNPNFDLSTYRRDSSNNPGAGFPKDITDAHKDGVTDTINVNISGNLNVESVQVKVQVSHTYSGDLGIELTSPSGTKSILMNINNSFLLGGDQNLNITLGSHAFYGETANGNWTLKVIDGLSGDTGHLTRWDLNILGH